MDSAGSGSLQSSSGGGGDDQEYDSRVDHHSISSFLNPNSATGGHFNIHHPQQQPPLPLPPQSNASFFDPSSPFSVSHSQVPNPLYNSDPLWSRNLLRSDPTTYTDFGANNNTNNQSFLGGGGSQPGLSTQQKPFSGPSSTAAARASTQPPDHHQFSNVGAAAGTGKTNPKKRTRASRRAPTTVLTTDTSNFRQMVQEFTGIPAAPFSAASSSFSRRLDLFGGGGASAMGSLGPLYPLRPSAQKLQLPSQFLSNNSNSSPSSFLNSDAATAAAAAITNNFQQQQQPTDHVFQKQTPQSLLNLQNPLFTFQSLLQQNTADHRQQQPNTTMQQNNNNPSLNGQQVNQTLGGFPSSSSAAAAATTTRWRDDGENLGGFDGDSGNVRGYKLNNNSSSSEFQSEKGLDNRGGGTTDHQGNVDSWILPNE